MQRCFKRSSADIESEHDPIHFREHIRSFKYLDDDSDVEDYISTKDQNEEDERGNGDDGKSIETDKETDFAQNAAQSILALSSQQCSTNTIFLQNIYKENIGSDRAFTVFLN